MKTYVKAQVINEENGQVVRRYCEKCGELLSEEFYNGSGAVQFLGVWDCKHYTWVFVGDFYLDPPHDPETKAILGKAYGKVSTSGGKYFLLPKQ
jgi:hypothetical protein